MLKHWFHGFFGKLAGFGYVVGALCLMAALAISAFPTAASSAPSSGLSQIAICPEGEGWSSHQAPPPESVSGADQYCGKFGTKVVIQASLFDCELNQEDMEWTCDGYPDALSHWGYHIPANTPVTPGNTPTNTQVTPPGTHTSTPTNKPVTPTDTTLTNTPTNPPVTPTDTPTNTATNTPVTPTNTPTESLTPTSTNTLPPGVTPTETPEPSATPTPTPGPPVLIDPKEDNLLTDNDGNGVPSPGDVLLYTITITNEGESAATAANFSDTPDPNTNLVVGSVTTTNGTITRGNTAGDTSIGVAIGTIAVDETVTITFEATIVVGIPASVGQVENQGLIVGENFPDTPSDDPDTQDPDDPTITLIIHPTPTPTSTPQNPGDPTQEPTDPPESGGTPTVLIPVTGVDRSTTVQTGFDLQALLLNLGLSLSGLGLIFHGAALYRRRRSD